MKLWPFVKLWSQGCLAGLAQKSLDLSRYLRYLSAALSPGWSSEPAKLHLSESVLAPEVVVKFPFAATLTRSLFDIPQQSEPQRLFKILLILCWILIVGMFATVWAQTIGIVTPAKPGTKIDPIENTGGAKMVLRFSVSDPTATPKIRIVSNAITANGFGDYSVQTGSNTQRVTLNLLRGTNEITLFGYSGDPASINPASSPHSATIFVACVDDDCGKAKDLIAGAEQTAGGSAQTTTQATGTILIGIADPTSPKDAATIQPLIKIKKTGISKVWATVTHDDDQVDRQVLDVVYIENEGYVNPSPNLKLVSGKNLITVVDPKNPQNLGSIEVTCGGPKCGKVETAQTVDKSQKGTVTINSPAHPVSVYNNTKFNAPDVGVIIARKPNETENVKKVRLQVMNGNRKVPQETTDKDVTFPDDPNKKAELAFASVRILKGVNQITVFDPDNQNTERDFLEIRCDQGCETELEAPAVTVLTPSDGKEFDTSFADVQLSVNKSEIKKIKYYVLHDGETVVTPKDAEVANVSDHQAIVHVKFVEGANLITFVDADDSSMKPLGTLKLKCAGAKCAHDFLTATIATNSMNTRAIVGMEQVGASSASSET